MRISSAALRGAFPEVQGRGFPAGMIYAISSAALDAITSGAR